jgi:tetratricopeptide (TPR) repeat protein
VVDALFKVCADRAIVQNEVQRDPWLSEGVRKKALALALTHKLSTAILNNSSWAVVREPGRSHQEYAKALREAELAIGGGVWVSNSLVLLGIAHYRLAKYSEALEALTRSTSIGNNLVTRSALSGRYIAQAFLAMTHYQLGHKERAHGLLNDLRQSLSSAGAGFPDVDPFVREAESLIEGATH